MTPIQITIVLGGLVIIILIIFFLKKNKLILTDEQHKFWDIFIKATSAILTIGTIIISAITFLNNQTESIKQKEREYRKEIATRQLNYYTEISEAAADFLVMASYPDSLFTSSYYVKKNNYEKLYFGKMNLVESVEVDNKIHDFSVVIEKFEIGNDDVDIHQLRLAAFALNEACRKSIRTTWDIDLETLNKLTK